MAQLLQDSYPLPEWKYDGLKTSDKDQPHEIEMKRLVKEETVIVFGVADGGAYYLVKSMKPLKLQHIPYGDAYRVSPIMIRGLRAADIPRYKCGQFGF